MATQLDIWNRAAQAAGETQIIASLTETTVVATAIARVYDDFVREVLTARAWAWAIAQVPLTEVSDQTIAYSGDGATTQFTVPYDIGDASQLAVTINGVAGVPGTDYTFAPPANGFPALVTFTTAPALSVALSFVVSTSRVGWSYVYAVPSDCIRALALLHCNERRMLIREQSHTLHDVRESFAIVLNNARSGYLVVTENDDFVALEYVAFVRNPTIYPPHFVEAVVRRIAAHLLNAIKKSPQEAMAMMQQYQLALASAVAASNSSNGALVPPLTPALAARW